MRAATGLPNSDCACVSYYRLAKLRLRVFVLLQAYQAQTARVSAAIGLPSSDSARVRGRGVCTCVCLRRTHPEDLANDADQRAQAFNHHGKPPQPHKLQQNLDGH